MRLRILTHALDRTGPPALALAFARWATRERSWEIDVVSFRGGAMEADLGALGPVHVLLDPDEPWDHDRPDPARVAALCARTGALEVADVVLLVSVAAGQVLTVLDPAGAPVVTWVVELGEDLHWIDDLTVLRERTAHWLAGSTATAAELAAIGVEAPVVAEFVEAAAPAASAAPPPDDRPGLHVIGAGIGTHRKGIDLFVETALAVGRAAPEATVTFTWVGGERDPLHGPAQQEAERLDLPISFLPSTPDLVDRIAEADVFLHPARLDAFPLVGLHAALAGTPVVAFEGTGGIEEMFGPTFCGVAYPDVPGLAAAVLALADPTRRAEVARAQAAHVRDRFESEVAAPALAAVLERASSGVTR